MSETEGAVTPTEVSVESVLVPLVAEVRAIRFQVEPGPYVPDHARQLWNILDELSRVFGSDLFAKSLANSDEFVQRSFVGFTKEFLATVRGWSDANREFVGVYPFHAIYDFSRSCIALLRR